MAMIRVLNTENGPYKKRCQFQNTSQLLRRQQRFSFESRSGRIIRAKMRFAFIIATLVAGALAGPLVEPFQVLDEDSVSLPDFQFTVLGLPTRDVKFTQGKVEGLRTVLRPVRGCYGRYKGEVSVSGLKFTYKAVATEPEQEVDVVVQVLHGLLSVDSDKALDGDFTVKDHRVRSLNLYVREPVEFTSDRAQNRLFEEQLKQKLAKLLDELTQTGAFKDVFEKVV